jgi:acyl-CoA thioesterase-1
MYLRQTRRPDPFGGSVEALKGRVGAGLRGKIRRFELVAKKTPSYQFVVVALLFFACGSRGDFGFVRNLHSQGKNVICFGDSLTEGVGAEKGESYPAILARELPYPIVNAGRGGDTSADGLARLERDVLGEDPRLVIVLFGGNDFLRKIPLNETEKNLKEIVRRTQERGAMVVLIGMKLGLFTDEYGPLYRDIANSHGALLIPEILKDILSDPKLKSDSIHPNGAGYRLMAERILKQVKPLLQEADRKKAPDLSGA